MLILKLININLFIITLTFINLTFAQSSTSATSLSDDENPCVSSKTCSECITSSSMCSWCLQVNYNGIRCNYQRSLEASGCNEFDVYKPQTKFNTLIDNQLSNITMKEIDAIQIRPQRVSLKIRPKSPHTLHVKFRQAVDYPVDLYYLMDLSKSMLDDKDKLASLGDLLASEMQRITSNFRLGFGSFVDKVTMPYVNMLPERIESPCNGCVRPYGFKNHMPLNTDTSLFKTKVNETQISGNLDAPEGGFDAIMQSVVCLDEIKWRKNSRKLLVFSTDSSFHYAGDGKLGGVVKPNDGECHMENGVYTASLDQDYPSVSQIHQKVKEYDVNLIFAVTEKHFSIYDELKKLIQGSSAGQLLNDSSNIVDLVKDEYKKITSSVQLKDNATDDIKITYHSNCVNEERKETSKCSGLHVGTTIEYDVTIEALRCPTRLNERNQTIVIKPVALSDQLIIDLELICDCDCEKPWNGHANSEKCNGVGTYECGICSCNKDRYGDNCQCDATELSQAAQDAACFRENDIKPCSGRGVCNCGKCDCFKRNFGEVIYGKYCECENFGCDRHNDVICSGPEHGTCDCGVCKCNANWTGSACECKKSIDECIAPNSEKICSEHGECICGECICNNNGSESYLGKYCEQCPTCPTQCENFKSCVQCQMWNTGNLTKDECVLCPFMVVDVEKLEVNEEQGEIHCYFIDDDGCKAQFKYRVNDEEQIVYTFVSAQRDKECPIVVNVFAIVLSLILAIVLIGLLLLLCWKIYTVIHDRREYAKFEKERQMAKWDTGENPIYKQATSTFKNPTYGK